MGFYYWVDLWRFPFSQFTENVIVINFSCLFINLLFLLEFKFFGKLISIHSGTVSSPTSFRYCIGFLFVVGEVGRWMFRLIKSAL